LSKLQAQKQKINQRVTLKQQLLQTDVPVISTGKLQFFIQFQQHFVFFLDETGIKKFERSI